MSRTLDLTVSIYLFALLSVGIFIPALYKFVFNLTVRSSLHYRESISDVQSTQYCEYMYSGVGGVVQACASDVWSAEYCEYMYSGEEALYKRVLVMCGVLNIVSTCIQV